MRPTEKTFDIRIISDHTICTPEPDDVDYMKPFELIWTYGAGCFFGTHSCSTRAFHSWITRKGAVLIGNYNFEKQKVK